MASFLFWLGHWFIDYGARKGWRAHPFRGALEHHAHYPNLVGPFTPFQAVPEYYIVAVGAPVIAAGWWLLGPWFAVGAFVTAVLEQVAHRAMHAGLLRGFLADAHLLHHRKWRANYGFTVSLLWDMAFGTWRRP